MNFKAKANVIFSILTFFLLSLSNSTYAGLTQLLSISNEEDKEITRFLIETDKDDRIALKFHQDTHAPNGGLIRRVTATSTDLNQAKGLILKQQDKYIVVALKSSNFDRELGGVIKIDTLVNGATGARKIYEINLAKDKTGWSIFNRQNTKITKMHLVSNKLKLFGTVGIKEIKMN